MITDMTENNNGDGSPRRLLRVRDGRLFEGVAAGLAAYFGIDANLVRLGFGVLTVFYGLGILLYVIAWAVIPEEGEDKSILEGFFGKFLR